MRAAQTQSLLAAVKRLPAADKRAVLDAIGAESVERALATLPVGWLSMSLHMHISDAIRSVLGPARNVEVWRDAMRFSFDRPLLRSFVALTTGIFGVSPRALLQRSDKVYDLLTRRCGSLSFEPTSERAASVTLVGFPAHRYQFICYVEGLAGCLEATLDLCRAAGKVSVVDQSEHGRVRYAVNW